MSDKSSSITGVYLSQICRLMSKVRPVLQVKGNTSPSIHR